MKVFNSLPELVFYIVDLYVRNNPNASIDEIVNTFSPLINKTSDMNNKYPFIKETSSIILSGADIKRFSEEEILIDGRYYRVSTQWGYKDNGKKEIDNIIKFAEDEMGEIVQYLRSTSLPSSRIGVSVPTPSTPVDKLKEHDDELLSFYIAETKSILTKQQYIDISNVEVIIDETDVPYYEIVGRYDLREIIEEIERLLERNSNVIGDFRELLGSLLRILWEILELEPPLCDFPSINPFGVNGEPFNIPNFSFQLISQIRDLDSKLKSIIEEIRRMLNEGHWSEETRRLLEDILNRIWPKIVGRKRASNVLGMFTASKNRITLYRFAIENWLPDVDYFNKLLDVYSHELFHAFHFVHMDSRKKWGYDDNSRMMKESLARYIEYRFGLLNICETAISLDLVRMWNDYDMNDFPYAGAKYVDKYNGLCELMFKESVNKGTNKAFHLIESAYAL